MHDIHNHHLPDTTMGALKKLPREATRRHASPPPTSTVDAKSEAREPPTPRRASTRIDWPDGTWEFLSGDRERDRRNLRLVMETVGELYGRLQCKDRMRHAVDRAVSVTEAERGFLLVEGPGGLRPHVARDAEGRDLPLDTRHSHTVVQRAWETGQPEIRPCHAEGGRLPLSESIPALRLKSIMAMRLVYEGRRTGVLYVDARCRTKAFTECEQKVFLTLGGLIATAIENARLEAESMERECMARRLRLAREVQMRLLPRDIAVPEGFDIAGVGEVCHDLSGDYYDVVPRPDRDVALVIGDVSDHSIAAALHMVTTRALVHRLMEEDSVPANALAHLNRVLEQDMETNEFMSLFMGILDPRRRVLTYASAGHNPPLLRHADGSIEEFMGTGPILNLLPDFAYGSRGPIALDSGDVLLLYTDGLTEGKNASNRLWGEEGLRTSLDRHVRAGRDAQGILDGVMADAEAHRGPGPLDDDITALAVRVL